jgi:bifunctional DNA-binding transcriptional regulator/antitoxin component of YhaV-PrlF toxin-antitoxin module
MPREVRKLFELRDDYEVELAFEDGRVVMRRATKHG